MSRTLAFQAGKPGASPGESVIQTIRHEVSRFIGKTFGSTWFNSKYVKRVGGQRPRIYSFDLQGHGTMQFPENGVACLAGWSDKTMETLSFLDRLDLLHEGALVPLKI